MSEDRLESLKKDIINFDLASRFSTKEIMDLSEMSDEQIIEAYKNAKMKRDSSGGLLSKIIEYFKSF